MAFMPCTLHSTLELSNPFQVFGKDVVGRNIEYSKNGYVYLELEDGSYVFAAASSVTLGQCIEKVTGKKVDASTRLTIDQLGTPVPDRTCLSRTVADLVAAGFWGVGIELL
jgi:hypothetical protein